MDYKKYLPIIKENIELLQQHYDSIDNYSYRYIYILLKELKIEISLVECGAYVLVAYEGGWKEDEISGIRLGNSSLIELTSEVVFKTAEPDWNDYFYEDSHYHKIDWFSVLKALYAKLNKN